jgi:hypothetical protein
VTLRVSGVDAARRFYELALTHLGYGEPCRGGHFFEWEDLNLGRPRGPGRDPEPPPRPARPVLDPDGNNLEAVFHDGGAG